MVISERKSTSRLKIFSRSWPLAIFWDVKFKVISKSLGLLKLSNIFFLYLPITDSYLILLTMDNSS